jgi:hypothetical protein
VDLAYLIPIAEIVGGTWMLVGALGLLERTAGVPADRPTDEIEALS